jgi:pimeloyl-ACP methyl ester carboxylesterase
VSTIVAADGTAIAWRERGEGSPLVLCHGITTSDFFWRRMMPRWQARHRVITWDYKGHGESAPARTLAGADIVALADDLLRVLDAAGIERAPVIGFSMGSQVMLEAFRAAPKRFAALVSLLGTAGRLFDTALPPFGPVLQRLLHGIPTPGVHAAVRGLGTAMYAPGAALVVRALGYTGHVPERDIAAFREHFARLDPRTVAAIARAAGDHDARDVLAAIDVPLLVITGDVDRFAPAATVGVPMAEAAPKAELLRLPFATHTALFEHPMELALGIEAFFARHGV